MLAALKNSDGMKAEEITRAIVQANAKQLESIKGIGRKTAERLVLELRDKFGKQTNETLISPTVNNRVETDALNALVSLGIARPLAEQAITRAAAAIGSTPILEELIKRALKNI